jgi:predicted AAA+ superfamily ATPase
LDLKTNQEKEEYLLELVDSVILKDIFYFSLVKNSKNLIALLKLLAYQIGQLVNITDLANRLSISRSTVLDYLELLEKSFLIFRLAPFTKKRRDEIGKAEKVYFYDLGLRNALIRDFSPVEFRVDYGNLFENLVVVEILKLNSYYQNYYGLNYWRTTWGSEVDLILQKDEKLLALEIKTRNGKITPAFKSTYLQAQEKVVTLENFASFFQAK